MKYLIGNHKMNLLKPQLVKYFKALKKIAKNTDNYVGVCVPSVHLALAQKLCHRSCIHFGTQNMYFKESGAYTGEISADMLKDYDAQLVIIGHSERRNIFNESDEDINLKVKVALAKGITPILCIGESKEQRDNNSTNKVLKKQITMDLKDIEITDINKIIFAYEPIWAIGTGVSATSEDAEKTIKYIKDTIAKMYNFESIDGLVVLYGGSLNANNAIDILSKPHIDGGLIGGASLKLDEFSKIIDYKE